MLLQTVSGIIHLLRDFSIFVFNVSCLCGRLCLAVLFKIYYACCEICTALKIVGEELYRFTCELNSTINAIGSYLKSTTNHGFESVFNAVGIFCQHMQHFWQSTTLHSRLLATKTGVGLGYLFGLIHGGVLLIADVAWWTITIIPRTIWAILIALGDLLVFSLYGAAYCMLYAIQTIIQDVFRLTIGLLVLFLLIRHRHALKLASVRACRALAMFLCSILTSVVQRATSLLFFTRRNNTNAPQFVRSSPMSRNNRAASSTAEKIPDSQRCVACRDSQKCVLLLPCRHLCLCEECADFMVFSAHNLQCPLCRQAITQSISIYT